MKLSILDSKDFNVVKQLFLDVFSNEPWYDKWENDKQLTLYLQDLTDNKNSLSLVLQDENNKIVGASMGYVFNWWQGREYFIKEFFISREMQNKGIGSLFLDSMNEYLKSNKIKALWLATEKDVPAYKFYNKNGFKESKNTVFLAKGTD